MSATLDIQQILSLIPHRYPFILVDKVLDYKKMEYINAIKNVTMNEQFFTGHFPNHPVMPGVLILEAMAQTGAILSSLSRTPKEGCGILHLFAGIDKVKFKQIVVPGDQLHMELKLLGEKKDFWRMQGQAYVGDKLVCSAILLSAAKEFKK